MWIAEQLTENGVCGLCIDGQMPTTSVAKAVFVMTVIMFSNGHCFTQFKTSVMPFDP
jgi:hypothetical protein